MGVRIITIIVNKEEQNMKKTTIVTYPAVFVADEAEGYTVVFPDVPDVMAGGQSLGESLVNATDALGRFLYTQQANLPGASTITELEHRYPADFIQFVAADLLTAEKRLQQDPLVATETVPLGLGE